MAKARVSNNIRYKYPLPIHPIDDLPQLIPHNPCSWIIWLYKYIQCTNALETKIRVYVEGELFPRILVKDNEDMLYLWNNGFFGIGQYSRSEPTWRNRTRARLGYDQRDKSKALENITEQRRSQRLIFKKERERLQQETLQLRRNGGKLEDETALIERHREYLRKLKITIQRDAAPSASPTDAEWEPRPEDDEILDDQGDVLPLESLELMPAEAIFLTFALPVLNISTTELINRLLSSRAKRSNTPISYKDIHRLIRNYVTYHHYRSRGWCLKSGIKFGCDYLLYKRGPPFQHAAFSVTILDDDEEKDYTWFSCIARVTSSAKKTLLLCYVERLVSEREILDKWEHNDFKSVFASYRVTEVVYRRWVPGRNRD